MISFIQEREVTKMLHIIVFGICCMVWAFIAGSRLAFAKTEWMYRKYNIALFIASLLFSFAFLGCQIYFFEEVVQ